MEDHFSSTRFLLITALIVMVGVIIASMVGMSMREELRGMAKPDFIFAGANTKKSARSTLTVAPFAASLSMPVNAKFEKDDFASLSKELLSNPKYAGKTVLIAWNHSNLPGFAKALGAKTVPEWKDDV
ncbi:MAG: hypothetical protein AAB112_01200, partial [Thermodesulfobacteriota bacterium]